MVGAISRECQHKTLEKRHTTLQQKGMSGEKPEKVFMGTDSGHNSVELWTEFQS